jgi:hypothetical protein
LKTFTERKKKSSARRWIRRWIRTWNWSVLTATSSPPVLRSSRFCTCFCTLLFDFCRHFIRWFLFGTLFWLVSFANWFLFDFCRHFILIISLYRLFIFREITRMNWLIGLKSTLVVHYFDLLQMWICYLSRIKFKLGVHKFVLFSCTFF